MSDSRDLEFRFPAEIQLDHVAELRRAGERHIDANQSSVFDLSALETTGSIAAALLIGWFRYAHLAGRTVEFTGLPVSLQNIIDVSELTDVLPIREEPGTP